MQFGYSLEITIFLSSLAIIFSWLIFNLIQKVRMKIDKRFVLAILPWVLFTSASRVAQDFNLISLIPSSYIYWIIGFFVTIFVFSLHKKDKENYWKVSFLAGLAAFSIIFAFLPTYRNFLIFIYLLIFFLPWALIFSLFYKKGILSKENFLTLTTNSFASNIAFVKIQFFGYESIHFFPRKIISLFFPFSFVLISFFVVLAVLFILDKFAEKDLRNYIKFLIGIFALLTGTRALF